MEPLQIRVWWHRSRSFNLSSVLSWNVAMWTHTRQLDGFCSGGDFLMTYLMAFSVRRSTILLRRWNQMSSISCFVGRNSRFFFLGAWFIETGTCASGCSCTCRGHSAKQLLFGFKRTCKQFEMFSRLNYVFRFFVDALRDWIQDTCLFDSSTRANNSTKWYI